MKKEVKEILKEAGKLELFTEDRFETVKELMKLGMKQSPQLKGLLSIDPYYKSKYIADYIILLVGNKSI